MSNKIEIKIIDLPKGYDDWVYKPPRPTEYKVRVKGANFFVSRNCTLQEPLTLHVGDILLFNNIEEIPPQISELYNPSSSHPVYAVLTVKLIDQADQAELRPKLI